MSDMAPTAVARTSPRAQIRWRDWLLEPFGRNHKSWRSRRRQAKLRFRITKRKRRSAKHRDTRICDLTPNRLLSHSFEGQRFTCRCGCATNRFGFSEDTRNDQDVRSSILLTSTLQSTWPCWSQERICTKRRRDNYWKICPPGRSNGLSEVDLQEKSASTS